MFCNRIKTRNGLSAHAIFEGRNFNSDGSGAIPLGEFQERIEAEIHFHAGQLLQVLEFAANQHFAQPQPLGKRHVGGRIAHHPAPFEVYVGPIGQSLPSHASGGLAARAACAAGVRAVVGCVQAPARRACEVKHFLVDGSQLHRPHQSFADACLVGDDYDALEARGQQAQGFAHALGGHEFVGRLDVIAWGADVDDPIAVEEKGGHVVFVI